MKSLAMLQLSNITTNHLTCASSRKSITRAIPHISRPTGLAFSSRSSNLGRQRARIARVQVHASQSPNPFGGGGNGDEESSSLVADLALPAVGAVALLLIAGPIFGGVTAIFGLPIIITAGAAAFGFLDTLAAIFGVSPLVAAGVVASTTLGILLIPAFLKFGFIALAGYFVANLLFGGGGGGGDSDRDSDVTGGGFGSGLGSNSSSYFSGSNGRGSGRSSNRMNDFDARDVTIDVEAETIDD